MERPEGMSYEEYKEWRNNVQKSYKERANSGKIIPGTFKSPQSSTRKKRREMKKKVEEAGGLQNYLKGMIGSGDDEEEMDLSDAPTMDELIAEDDAKVFEEE